MIQTEGLVFAYPGAEAMRFGDFALGKGDHALLLGESGSGKTTLLHLLGGLLKASSGKIDVNGTDIAKLDEVQLDHFRGRNMGFIFQRNHLISALTVRQNLLMAPYMAGLVQNEKKADAILEELGLRDKSHARVSELSYGQAQRVAIGRALINEPSVIFADEPTSALDDTNCSKVIELLLETSRRHQVTLMVATHDQRLKEKISTHIPLRTR